MQVIRIMILVYLTVGTGMAASSLTPIARLPWIPKVQILDNNGDPLASGKVYTYITGTTTNQATYTDSGKGTANANPVILDAGGRADIWLDETLSYRIDVKTSADVLLYSVDQIVAVGASRIFGNLVQIGKGDAADTLLTFDGNAQDYYVALDDSADSLVIGVGNDAGTTPAIHVNSSQQVGINMASPTQELVIGGTVPTIIVGDAGEEDTVIIWDGSAQDYYQGLDDTDDNLWIGLGSTVGSTGHLVLDANQDVGIGGASAGAKLDVTGNAIVDGGADEVQLTIQGHSSQSVGVLVVENSAGTDGVTLWADGSATFLDASISVGGVAYEFPGDNGDAGEQLQTDGSGNLTWESASSYRAGKYVYSPVLGMSPEKALDRMMEVTVYPYRYREGHGTGDTENLYHGVMAEDMPEAMHHGDRILDPLSAFGMTVLAIQRLEEENRELRRRLEILESR